MTGRDHRDNRGGARRPDVTTRTYASARAGWNSPRGRGQRPFRPLRWAWLLLLIALLAPAYDLFLPAGWHPPSDRRTVVIERGQSLHEIATELQRVGLIRSQVGFLVLSRLMQLDRTVKAGQYSFRVGITVPALLRALDKGMFGLNLVTIPEGLMVSETANLIERQVGIRAAAIDSLAKDPAMLDSLEVSAPSLEGWLAPDSYEWLPGTSPEVVLRTMVARTRERVQHATAGYDSLPLGMNAHEVLTLASIVESESKANEERPHIARVYLNRLDRGMLLQADPTVGYALGRGPRSRLTFKDLRVESPYNTYRHEGLPPGPICSPGLSAIEAVMHATQSTNDLYFVANGMGRHIFSPTYEGHLANIAFVKGKKAAAEAAARRETRGRAAPDSSDVGASETVEAPVANAVKPAAPAGHAPAPTAATAPANSTHAHTPAKPGGTTTASPAAPPAHAVTKPAIKAAATTPVQDQAVQPAGPHAGPTLASAPGQATTIVADTSVHKAAAVHVVKPAATVADTAAHKAATHHVSKPAATAGADTAKKAVPTPKPKLAAAKPKSAAADTLKKSSSVASPPAKLGTKPGSSTAADSTHR